MKRLISVLIILVVICPASAFAGCKKEFTRSAAAEVIAEVLEFTGGDKTPADLDGKNKNAAAIKACVSRDIFDTFGSLYNFRPKDKPTRAELAKIALNSYAALKFIKSENLEPGGKRNITDITDLTFEKKWCIYAAVEYGFIELDGPEFQPQSTVTQDELREVLGRVKEKAGVGGTDFGTYAANFESNFSTVPVKDIPVAKTVTVFEAGVSIGKYDRLLAATLQGLVNRSEVKLFLDFGQQWIMNYARGKEYFEEFETVKNINELLDKFGGYVKKAIVFDPEDIYTINTATDIAAIEGAVVIPESYVDRITAVNPDAELIEISKLEFKSQLEAQKYSFENCFPFLRRDIIEWAYYVGNTDWQKDYVIQMKIPTVWVPGKESVYYKAGINELTDKILGSYPANIPVLGFQVAASAKEGLVEEDALAWCGEYGKYSVILDTVGNLSVFSCLKASPDDLKFNTKIAETPAYNADKKYVAFNMNYGGESPAYMQLIFKSFQWDAAERGSFAYTYNYGIAVLELMPVLARYFAETATENDYFYNSMSGLGVATPTLGYGTKVPDMTQDDVLSDYFRKTNSKCKLYGFNAVGLYSSVERSWTEDDYKILEQKILPNMQDIDFVVPDKFMVGGLAGYILKLGGKNIFHCPMLTIEEQEAFGDVNNTAKNGAAAEYLAEEILAADGQFIMCPVSAWYFGPRRIKMAIDKLNAEHPGQYEFVTMQQLNALVG